MNIPPKKSHCFRALFIVCAALVCGGIARAWAQPPEYIPRPIDPSSLPKPGPEVLQMVNQWKEAFVKLKSLQLEIKSFLSNGKETKKGRQLLGKETFAYDNPRFLEHVTLFKADGAPGETEGEAILSYDGHYYYSFVDGFGGGTTRARKLDASFPPVTFNPLTYLFQFVINGTDAKYFCSLTDPAVWDNFARRVTDFKKDAHTGEVTFSCETYDSKYEPGSTYEVKAAPVDGILMPVSVQDPEVPGYRWEIVTTDFAEDAKSTFGLPFPLRMTVVAYHDGVPVPQTRSDVEVDEKSLKINQPVTAVFTLTDPDMMDADSLSLTPH